MKNLNNNELNVVAGGSLYSDYEDFIFMKFGDKELRCNLQDKTCEEIISYTAFMIASRKSPKLVDLLIEMDVDLCQDMDFC